MNFNLLNNFFNSPYFTQGSITLTSKDYYYNKGHVAKTLDSTYVIKGRKVLVPVDVKDLVDAGLGEYGANETFHLFVKQPLRYSSGSNATIGDLVTYDDYDYKLISVQNYKTHGFYHYMITKFKEAKLND